MAFLIQDGAQPIMATPVQKIRSGQFDESSTEGAFSLLRRWIARWRQRKALGELVVFNRHMLRDIGLSAEEARLEADKPFWRR